ncbi:hypothetical protein Q5752_005762 [Cryptotrichosporon argae]
MMLAHLAVAALPLVAAVAAGSSHAHGVKRAGHKRHGHPARAPRPDPDADADLTPRNITKRDTYTGRGTYFYVGLGACGETSVDSDLMVALNIDQYGSGYPGPECFKYITVEANGITVSGIEILDECPTCDYGGLDMSPGLFTKYADESVGTLAITWWFEDSSSTSYTPTSTSTYQYTPTTTSTWQYTPTTTSTWHAPSSTSTWVAPSSTSTWVAPTSTYTPPTSTSTWVAPTPTSTWSSVAASSSALWSSASASASLSASLNASIALNATTSANPFAVVSSTNATASISGSSAAAASASASGSTASTGSSSTTSGTGTNLVQLNALTAQYGQLVVVAASQ